VDSMASILHQAPEALGDPVLRRSYIHD